MTQKEKKNHTIFIAGILIFTMGIIFLIMGMQSFWYTYTVNKDIREQYSDFTKPVEESYIASYIRDASYMATQPTVITAVMNNQKRETTLIPFEYFLLNNPAFMRGYVVNSNNVKVSNIAHDKNDTTQSTYDIDAKFSQAVLSNNAIEVYTHADGIVDIGIPIYQEKRVIGAVVMSFSLAIAKSEYVDMLIYKQSKELEKDLFNRKEFIYTLIIVGLAFTLISIGLFNVYLQIHTGHSLIDRMRKKRKGVMSYPSHEDDM